MLWWIIVTFFSRSPGVVYFSAQRSAQELPQIETFSPTCDSVMGGQELLITGPNITPESKVIFLEKGHGKRHPQSCLPKWFMKRFSVLRASVSHLIQTLLFTQRTFCFIVYFRWSNSVGSGCKNSSWKE